MIIAIVVAQIFTLDIEPDSSPFLCTTRFPEQLSFALSFQPESYFWFENSVADEFPVMVFGERIRLPLKEMLPDVGVVIGRDMLKGKSLTFDFKQGQLRRTSSKDLHPSVNSEYLVLPFRWNTLGAEVSFIVTGGVRAVTLLPRDASSFVAVVSGDRRSGLPVEVRPYPETDSRTLDVKVGDATKEFRYRLYEGKPYVNMAAIECERIVMDMKDMRIIFVWAKKFADSKDSTNQNKIINWDAIASGHARGARWIKTELNPHQKSS